jgi:pSer/pThr/pTyr-binding forkhead associated (FHA) protein
MHDPARKPASDKPPLSSMRELRSRRYALRSGNRVLPLDEGDTILGRGTDCGVVLEDALVSRRHARLRLSRGTVTLLDLGSRNGVLLNDQRVEGEVVLEHGDRIGIGSLQLGLVEAPRNEERHQRESGGYASRTLTDLRSPFGPPADAEDETTCTAHAFELLASVVDKALAAGRADEVSRLLLAHLEHFARDCETGKPLPKDTRSAVAHYAVKLTEATSQPTWFDLLLRIYAAEAEPLPLEAVDALYRLLRRVRGVSRSLLRTYIERLHDRTQNFGPAERFAVKRIEGLLQIMAD